MTSPAPRRTPGQQVADTLLRMGGNWTQKQREQITLYLPEMVDKTVAESSAPQTVLDALYAEVVDWPKDIDEGLMLDGTNRHYHITRLREIVQGREQPAPDALGRLLEACEPFVKAWEELVPFRGVLDYDTTLQAISGVTIGDLRRLAEAARAVKEGR